MSWPGDGLVNEITDDEIGRILCGWPEEPDRAACALLNTALCGDALDNVTVAVLDVVVEGGPLTVGALQDPRPG